MKVQKEHTKFTLNQDLDYEGLEVYLDLVWRNRAFIMEGMEQDQDSEQQFLQLLPGKRLKTGKYVGFLQYQNFSLCILPKICNSNEELQIELFNHNLSFWLSYCRSISFPFSSVLSEQSINDNFPEALIFYFAQKTYFILQQTPFNKFENVEEKLQSVKGRILFNRYINESLTKGQGHKIVCEHEPLTYDNTFNRVIKYVARCLLQKSKFKETWYYLENILFLLDDAEDIFVTEKDCDRIILNQAYSNYNECLGMCRFFLRQEQISGFLTEQDHFCFLLPMYQVYEEFISGFIDVHFSSIFKVVYQNSSWLTDQEAFRMRQDIVLIDQRKIALIIDTKYKLRDRKADAKRGVSQDDFYQMLAYAVKSNCRKILLLYPLIQGKENQFEIDRFTVSSELFPGEIEVYAGDLQIFSASMTTLEESLKKQISTILLKIS
jgi:5-methylcytosine-specific restriction enzyme subunit McrC